MLAEIPKPPFETFAEAFAHISETFRHAERYAPDVMERYSAQFAEAATDEERMEIMRRGLRETINDCFPLATSQGIKGHVTDGA